MSQQTYRHENGSRVHGILQHLDELLNTLGVMGAAGVGTAVAAHIASKASQRTKRTDKLMTQGYTHRHPTRSNLLIHPKTGDIKDVNTAHLEK